MSIESGSDRTFAVEHGDTLEAVRGLIRGKLVAGAYDVLENHHEDLLVLTSGELQYEHRLSQAEAKQLEDTVWSAGEDPTLDNLLDNVQVGLRHAGFNLTGDHLDIAVHLQEVPLDS